MCPSPTPIPNTDFERMEGWLTSNGAIHGTVLEYSCSIGYRDSRTPCLPTRRTCHAGEWIGNMPSCGMYFFATTFIWISIFKVYFYSSTFWLLRKASKHKPRLYGYCSRKRLQNMDGDLLWLSSWIQNERRQFVKMPSNRMLDSQWPSSMCSWRYWLHLNESPIFAWKFKIAILQFQIYWIRDGQIQTVVPYHWS